MVIEDFNDVYLRNVSAINVKLYIVSANMHSSFHRSIKDAKFTSNKHFKNKFGTFHI